MTMPPMPQGAMPSDHDGDEPKAVHPRRRKRGSRGRGGKGRAHQQVQQHMDAMQQAHASGDHQAFRANLFKALTAHNAIRKQASAAPSDHDGDEGGY